MQMQTQKSIDHLLHASKITHNSDTAIYNSIAITAMAAPISPVPPTTLLTAELPDCVACPLAEEVVALPVLEASPVEAAVVLARVVVRVVAAGEVEEESVEVVGSDTEVLLAVT
jgi:ADP-ribosylglycohydrolase